MSDILSYGRDRPPRWPRRRKLAAVTVGLAVSVSAVIVSWSAWHAPHTRPYATGASPTAPAGAGSPAAGPSALPTRPGRMTGQPLAADAGLRLLLGGTGPAWLSVATGQAQTVRGLAGRPYQFVRIDGGWAAEPFPAGGDGCDQCAPGPLPVYYLADGARTASRVGTAGFAAPAAVRGALWLVSFDRGADMATAVASAQEVSVTGARLGPRLRLPAGYVVGQGTRAGLLLEHETAGAGPVTYELWDPGTSRVRMSFTSLIAAGPAEIAWMPSCAADCVVRVLSLSGGGTREISLPGRSTAWGGAFSADGRFLALQVTAGAVASGRPAATRLMVAAVASSQATAVPGTTVGSGNAVAFGWAGASHRLIADLALDAPGQPRWQIAVWRPGDAQLSITVVRVQDGSWPVIDQGPY